MRAAKVARHRAGRNAIETSRPHLTLVVDEAAPAPPAPRLPGEVWRQLQASEATGAILEGVFNSNVIGLTVFDLTTLQTIRANDYLLRLIGATRAEFESGARCCYTATPPEWRWLDDRAVAEAQEKGSWAPFEKEYERPDGSRVPVRVYSAPMPGMANLVVVCIEDLTEHRRAEERLKLLQSEVNHLARLSAMGTMASILAHEVAQPMLAVSNALAALEHLSGAGATLDDHRAAQALALARRQAARATELLQRIRRFAAPDRNARGPVDVRETIEDAAALALMRMPEIDLTITTSSRAARVIGDAIQIEQVLVNLVRNAAEAMQGRGRIEIAARRLGDQVEIGVTDNGPGFGDDAAGAFKAFATTKADGTGLGLAICREIVERHGGAIRIDGKAKGGRVLFTLPHAA